MRKWISTAAIVGCCALLGWGATTFTDVDHGRDYAGWNGAQVVLPVIDANFALIEAGSITQANLNVSDSIIAGTNITAGATVQGADVTATDDVTAGDDLTVGDDTILGDALTVSGAVTQVDATASTDKDTGAYVTEGGIGIEKDINAGGDIDSGAAITAVTTVSGADGSFSDDLTVLDDTILGDALTVSGAVTQVDSTASTSKDTGAYVTEGGIGIELDINAGGDIDSGAAITAVTTVQGEQLTSTDDATVADSLGVGTNVTAGGVVDAESVTTDAGSGIDVQSAGTLMVGAATATKIEVGLTAVETEVQGTLDVLEAADFDTTVDVAGETTLAGSQVWGFLLKTSGYTNAVADAPIVSYNTSASTTNVLPEASTVQGKLIIVCLQDDDGDLVIDTDGTDKFDGTNNRATLDSANESLWVVATAADVYTVVNHVGAAFTTQ